MATYLESVRHTGISFLEQLTMENKLSKYDHRPPHGLSVSTSRSRQESCVIDASMDKGPVTRASGGYWTCSKRQSDLIVGLSCQGQFGLCNKTHNAMLISYRLTRQIMEAGSFSCRPLANLLLSLGLQV